MSSAKEKKPRSRLVILLLFIPLLAVVAWRLTPLPSYLFKLANPPEKIAETILADPIAANSIKQFSVSFPEEFDQMIAYVGKENKIGSAAEKQQKKALKFLGIWLTENSEKVMQAPAAELSNLADANLAYVSELKNSDISICAKFTDIGFLPHLKLEEKANLLSQDALNKAIVAAKAGTDQPAGRQTKPSEDTMALFRAELTKEGLSPRQQEVLDKGVANVDRPISPVDICTAGHATYSAISRMPTEEKANFMAFLFSRTFRFD